MALCWLIVDTFWMVFSFLVPFSYFLTTTLLPQTCWDVASLAGDRSSEEQLVQQENPAHLTRQHPKNKVQQEIIYYCCFLSKLAFGLSYIFFKQEKTFLIIKERSFCFEWQGRLNRNWRLFVLFLKFWILIPSLSHFSDPTLFVQWSAKSVFRLYII